MTIIEQNITGKHTAADCEDGIVVTDGFVAVIDGSTSKTAKRINPEMRNGRYCMTIIADYIRTMPRDISLDDFCNGITARIHSLYPADDSRLAAHPEERLCAVAAVYSDYHKEVWLIGDCQCMVGGKLYSNGKPSEKVVATKRSSLFAQALADHPDMTDGHSHIVHDYARDAILPDLIASMQDENKTYAVIDGFPIYKEGIKVVKAEEGTIVLASDGYPFLCPTLVKSEDKLRRQLADDPYNVKTFLATKGLMQGNVSFDDRAYIRFSTAPRQRYFLTLSFDGTAYHGWQIQPNGMSVQERLQDCLSKILRRKMEVTGAGRTDAGVHARTMVCHFDDDAGLDCRQLTYRLNHILPQDISCREIRPVAADMHARFSAKKRTYRYFIHTDKDPFRRQYSVETHYHLDFALMNEAAAWLTTVSDFKAFCKAGADNKTTICHVSRAGWFLRRLESGIQEFSQMPAYGLSSSLSQESDGGTPELQNSRTPASQSPVSQESDGGTPELQNSRTPESWYFEISADRFLRNMVRAVVGTLFDVGRHRLTLEQFRQTVLHGSRSDSGESMPAKALFLWDIEY